MFGKKVVVKFKDGHVLKGWTVNFTLTVQYCICYGLICKILYLLFYQRTTRRNRKESSSSPLQVASSQTTG